MLQPSHDTKRALGRADRSTGLDESATGQQATREGSPALPSLGSGQKVKMANRDDGDADLNKMWKAKYEEANQSLKWVQRYVAASVGTPQNHWCRIRASFHFECMMVKLW